MKIGVFVPSIPTHFGNVGNIVDAYMSGEVKPDRIAVLISDSAKVPIGNRMRFRTTHKHWPVALYESLPLLQAGPCRQLAYDLLEDCDVIAYQDSDDLPHRDRIRVVKEIFEQYPEGMVLNHSYYYGGGWPAQMGTEPVVDWGVMPGTVMSKGYFPTGKLSECMRHHAFGDVMGFPVHAGVPCVRRQVLEEIRWKKAQDLHIAPEPKTKTEDYEFCMECLFKYRERHLLSDARVYLYRG